MGDTQTNGQVNGLAVKLSEKIVAAFSPGDRKIVWDDALPGFGVRISEGAVAYVVDFRIGRSRRRVSLGSTAKMKYDAAKNRARAIMVAAQDGRDITKGDRTAQPTFEQVWREMIDDIDRPKLSARTVADYEDRARRLILPKIGKKLVGEITPADVDKTIAATTGARNRAYVATLIKKQSTQLFARATCPHRITTPRQT